MAKTQMGREILRRAKDGDLTALEQILYSFERPLLSHLRRLVKDADDAEDLLQETFLKVFRYRRSIDPKRDIAPWLFTIATRAAFDFFRKRKRQAEVSLDRGEEPLLETIADESSYSRVEAGLAESDVRSALDRLKPVFKLVLTLYYKDGFQYDEIAEITGAPTNTVKTNLRRAKAALAEELKNYHG